MSYVFDFAHRHDQPPEHVVDLLGGKGAGLGVMTGELGLPVPPGFVITTRACRAYLADGWPDGLDEELQSHLARIETAIGRRYGGPGDPLLVSVRSGAPVSMPGMLDTILNVGLNDATAAELAAASGDAAFVAECRRRLHKMFRHATDGGETPQDPWQQLRHAVEAVFGSWNSDRARAYRAHDNIPDDLGTAVIVQAMVFGNRGDDSATGVVFTRNPATGERGLYGDVMFGAQGEDVVAGTHTPEPISVLEEKLPAVFNELREYAEVLERHYRDVCDIEFTVEQGKLWMLQTRIGKRSPQAALRIAVEMAEDNDFPLSRAEAVARVADLLDTPPVTNSGKPEGILPLTAGLPASPGLVAGEIVTTPDMAVERARAGHIVVLVRPETSPDDVHGMAQAAGILTSHGGLTSHAAVVARGWGIPAVVGASDVHIDGKTVSIGDRVFQAGDSVTIDGSTGEIYAGVATGETSVNADASKLLAWAREHEASPSEVAGADPGDGMDHPGAPPAPEAVVRALFVKGFATLELLAPALRTSPELLGPSLSSLTGDGLVTETNGMLSLTDPGKALGTELVTADRTDWGADNAVAALDDFVALDKRVKVVVTAWQMREVDGEQVLNDHTDAAYDESVLADLTTLHGEARAWLEPLTAGLGRLQLYAARLEEAMTRIAAGGHDFIASPRVDSYHTIWFELHEDLIHLAGRTRADEAAAGRA